MPDPSPRILIATALGQVIEPLLRESPRWRDVVVADGERAARAAVAGNLRFDAVLADLTWNDAAVEFAFDGFDLLEMMAELDRRAPVVLAAQGHGGERDHVDEAVERVAVAGLVHKAVGLHRILPRLERVALGEKLAKTAPPHPGRSLHAYFGSGRRGETAGRLAGAIAARRASNHDSLAAAARCSRNTAARVVDQYLAPLIAERGEHPDDLPLTVGSVYRWCGQHARYIVSWCRRSGHPTSSGPARARRAEPPPPHAGVPVRRRGPRRRVPGGGAGGAAGPAVAGDRVERAGRRAHRRRHPRPRS